MTYTAAHCITESDGFHLHEYQHGPDVVVEHLHTWNDEHQRNWPDSSFVYTQRGQTEQPYRGTVEQAWADLTDDPRPAAECTAQSTGGTR